MEVREIFKSKIRYISVEGKHYFVLTKEEKSVGDVLLEINREVFKVVNELMETNNKKGKENDE